MNKNIATGCFRSGSNDLMMALTLFDSCLLFLIEHNQNHEEVKWLIAKENLHKVVDINMNTLLHHAVKHGNQEVVQYLLESGSNVDALDGRMQTPLMLAMNINSKITIIEALVKAGANIYVHSKNGQSFLQVIGQMEFLSKPILRIFYKNLQADLSNNANEIAKKIYNARWPLTKVIELEDAELTKIMFQRNYVIDIDENVGHSRKTALHVAVQNSDVKNVKVLLEYNSTINLVDSEIRTPFSYLYEKANDCRRKLDILKMLLEKIDTIDPMDVTNILQNGNAEAIKLLFQKNIDPMSTAAGNGDRVIHILAQNLNSGVIQHLRNRNFDVNARNDSNQTPLIIAAEFGNTEAIEFLVNLGADVNATDDLGYTALFLGILVGLGNEEFAKDYVQILLERGANVEIEVYSIKKTMFDADIYYESSLLYHLVLAHLALQEAQGLSIPQLIFSQINSDKHFKVFFELSKQQLEAKIYEPTSLFDLLTTADKKFENYVSNDNFVSKVEHFMNSLSDNYYFLLQKRIKKAKEIVKLKREAGCAISKIMKTNYYRFPCIIDEIISCLECQEMRNLMDALS